MQERAAEERQAKLEQIRKQVSSGALVIRQMTRAERAKWDKQRAILDANFTQQNALDATLRSGIGVNAPSASSSSLNRP